jgi:thiol-disulfide isomerase/thioredoxin
VAAPTRPGGEAPPPTHLPEISLPCFTGGTPVRLAALGRPGVLNLWASYCAPCRAELPAFQQFAALAGNRLAVLGVVTNDTDDKAASLARDLKVSFPAVTDPQGTLLRSMGQNALPVTLFVAADGTVTHVDRSGRLDLPTLEGLARRYLGVSVG